MIATVGNYDYILTVRCSNHVDYHLLWIIADPVHVVCMRVLQSTLLTACCAKWQETVGLHTVVHCNPAACCAETGNRQPATLATIDQSAESISSGRFKTDGSIGVGVQAGGYMETLFWQYPADSGRPTLRHRGPPQCARQPARPPGGYPNHDTSGHEFA